jgi:S-(hydroxymethyl)glutathione dehydrogenase/alcohol dehydrogenase
MKAAILTHLNRPLSVEDIELTPLDLGQVLVKVLMSGICGSQLQEIRGEKNNEKFLPHLLGHEGCGIVQDVGAGVTKVKKGNKVIMHWRKGQGIESPFPRYVYKSKNISGGKVTTLSEYSIASENRLTVVDNDTPAELCALLGCGLSTALGVVNYDANIKFGENVLILGCGGIGINLLLGCKLANCGKAYIIDRELSKQQLAEANGGIFISSLSEITDKIDCIIDTVGSMTLLSESLPLLTDYGRAILICQPKKEEGLYFTNPINFFAGEGQTIRATQGGGVLPDRDFKRYVELYNQGKINLDNIVTHTLPLENVNEGIELVKLGKAGRVLIKFDNISN